MEERGIHLNILQNLLNRISNRFSEELPTEKNEEYKVGTLAAERDYIVTRVGWRSPAGEKIPIRYEKKLAVGKDNIFRPFIFQKEMIYGF